MRPEHLLAMSADANRRVEFARTFMISALTGSGCRDLLDYIAQGLPEGPWYYPEDQISDLPMRQLAAEITREKAMLRLHEEVPYEMTVETEAWEERKDGSVKIDQTIFVARESQRKIAIGAKGQSIKSIGELARKEMEELLHSETRRDRQAELRRHQEACKKRMLELLTDEQEAKYFELIGEPFRGELKFDEPDPGSDAQP